MNSANPGLPEPSTEDGRAGLAAVLADPGRALIALDFDGTLAPIVADPAEAYAHPAAAAALRRLSGRIGALVVITGRPAAVAVDLGGFRDIPGLTVLGNYGLDRWADGRLDSPPPPPGVAAARAELPGLLARAGAPAGTRTEDKGQALVVHTRQTADPAGALDRLRDPLTGLAARHGLTVEPGRMVLELRPHGSDKGGTLRGFVAEKKPGAVLYCGDDVGDLAAFREVRELRAAGLPGLAVCSASTEVSALADAADLVVDGPDGVVALLAALAGAIG